MSLSLVAYCDSSDSDTEEVGPSNGKEDTSQEGIKKLLSVLPPARSKRAGTGRHPVRIGLPKLIAKEDDSDEEDATPLAKHPKKGGSGLSALLPQPKGAPRQLGAAKRTKSTMIPYTLTKRRQDIKKPVKSRLVTAGKKSMTVEDSDSDDEPVSFFSHLDNPTVQEASVAPVRAAQISTSSFSETSNSTATSAVGLQPTYSTLLPATVANYPVRDTTAPAEQSQGSTQYSYNSAVDPQLYQQPSTGLQNQWFSKQYTTAQNYQPVYYEEEEQEGSNGGDKDESSSVPQPPPAMPGPGPGLSIDEESLRRLAGGKRRKNREENLNNIIEINEDEVKEGIKIYQKYHSEEAVNKLYKPDSSKIKAPTGDQKRKHQITYLAHQAKERELELRTHWSSASATRRQAAAKYGF